jgi:hypothetical protein
MLAQKVHLTKNYHKVCPGHPTFKTINMFYKASYINCNYQKHYLTLPYANAQNVLITCDNATITEAISQMYDINLEFQPLTVAKHLGEVMQMDVVVLLNTYCELASKEQAWDLHYYKCPGIPTQIARLMLHHP